MNYIPESKDSVPAKSGAGTPSIPASPPAAARSQSEPDRSRRHFLIGAVVIAGGLWVGPKLARRLDESSGLTPADAVRRDFALNPFVRVGSDDTVTLVLGKSEMGQGVYTSFAMIIADEIGVDVSRVKVEFAPVDPAYNSLLFPIQFTGGSSSIRTSYQQMRQAGATARHMLVAAAAKEWRTDAAQLTVIDGIVSDGTRRARLGELVEAAANVEVPKQVALKDPKDFKFIGKSIKRLDGMAKVTGQAEFGLDVHRPDMLYAMVAHSPVFGGKVESFDDKAARAIAGVVDVKQIPSGVAVLATNTWAARRGRDALEVKWNEGPAASLASTSQFAEYRALAGKPGRQVKSAGNVDKALSAAAKTIDADYELPYLSHSCMEPLNATVFAQQDRAEIWVGTQMQSVDRAVAAGVLGLKPEQVDLHTTFLGGGFGRRGNFQGDLMTEAAHVAKGVGKPVQLVWTREDDTRAGYYRPAFLHRIRGGLNSDGWPVAWKHTVVGQSIIAGTPMEHAFGKGPDPMSHEGIHQMPYAIENLFVDQHDTKNAVPVQFWRSVGHSATGFVVNGFLDELAAEGGRDPLELRRELLKNKPRHLAVLEMAAEKAGWTNPLPAGHGRGIALQESFGSIVAEVAEVSVKGDKVNVHRVVCVADLGLVVNPDNVAAQLESGIVFGLSAALYGAITLDAGRVQQSNFHDYPVLRLAEMPRVDTYLIESDAPMGGAGEISVPPIAPAVCNAIYAATGKRIRRLPLSSSLALVKT